MKTALAILQSVMRRQNIALVPTSLVGSTDPQVLQQIEILIAVLEELRQAACWKQQIRTYSFDTEADRTKYPLPADYYAPVYRTQYDQNRFQELLGPISDGAMNYRLYGLGSGNIDYSYRIVGFDENQNTSGGQFEIDPAPPADLTFSFEYYTSNLFIPPLWTPSTAIAGSGVYRMANGNIYVSTTSGTTGTTPPSHTTGTADDNNVTWSASSNRTPYETLITDSDLVIFDADLVKLGFRAKWREENGGDFQAAKFEFEKKISQAVSRLQGSYIGNFAQNARRLSYKIPEGSWSL